MGEKRAILLHVLENLFWEGENSALHQIMECNKVESILAVLSINDSELGYLQYYDMESNQVDISKVDVELIKSFKAFVAYSNSITEIAGDNDWLSLTHKDFDNFQV